MGVSGFSDLKEHVGHRIRCVAYGTKEESWNLAVECVTCGCVLFDFDHPEMNEDAPEENSGAAPQTQPAADLPPATAPAEPGERATVLVLGKGDSAVVFRQDGGLDVHMESPDGDVIPGSPVHSAALTAFLFSGHPGAEAAPGEVLTAFEGAIETVKDGA